MLVEKVPVFPGCENATNNNERRNCLNAKIAHFVKKQFDADQGSEAGLKGLQRIYVNFKITKNGDIQIMQTKASHVKLKEEAKRVITKLPKMTPAQHGNKTVDVMYTLPIVIQVQN